jgi:hypothetical protein
MNQFNYNSMEVELEKELCRDLLGEKQIFQIRN